MTAATTITLCRCGHAERAHSEEDGCGRSECGCAEFRPGEPVVAPPSPVASPQPSRGGVVVPPRPVPAAAPRPAQQQTVGDMLAAARRSRHVTTRRMGERIEKALTDLLDRLVAERAEDERHRAEEQRRTVAAARVAELEKQLAEARAALNGSTPRRPRQKASDAAPPGEPFCCTESGCDRTFAYRRGLTRHLKETHGVVTEP